MAVFTSKSFTVFDDNVKGTNKNDTFYVSPGIVQRDFINGLKGYDKVVIGIRSRNFAVRRQGKNVFLEGTGQYPYQDYTLINIEKIIFSDKAVRLQKKRSSNSNSTKNSKYNEVIGSKDKDVMQGTNVKDFLWGGNGDDILYGNDGNDLIVGGKGTDYLYGGRGNDVFGVSKKNGKGVKNYDVIFDFEIGKDSIYVNGSVKGLWIDNYKGNAFLVRGENDVIAMIDGAGGRLDWGTGVDSDLIM